MEKAGIEVMLDIHNMEGDIDKYMMDGIKDSDKVLLVSFKNSQNEFGNFFIIWKKCGTEKWKNRCHTSKLFLFILS